MPTCISDTTTLLYALSDHVPLSLDYDPDLSPSMFQQLGIKWLIFSSANQEYQIPPIYGLVEELIVVLFGISTYFIFYLVDPIMYMLLEDLPYWLLEWFWYLSYSQVIQHYTHCLHPTRHPQTVKTTSPSAPSSLYWISLGLPCVSLILHLP